MTMVIIGIISAVAIPRFFDTSIFQSRGAADQVRAALRYGQKVAIAQRREVAVALSAGANTNCDTTVTMSGVSCVISDRVTPALSLPGAISFDALGRPFLDGALWAGASPIQITVGGLTIYVERETGYVH